MVCNRLRMDMYGKADDGVPTKKPWTEQEVLLLLEVCDECLVVSVQCDGRWCAALRVWCV